MEAPPKYLSSIDLCFIETKHIPTTINVSHHDLIIHEVLLNKKKKESVSSLASGRIECATESKNRIWLSVFGPRRGANRKTKNLHSHNLILLDSHKSDY